jgi:hypothetical protein
MASEEPSQTATNDTIIPFHFWDDVPYTRGICLNVTLRFEEVLDTKQLHDSLERLFEIGNWRKLGARLRQNVNQQPSSQTSPTTKQISTGSRKIRISSPIEVYQRPTRLHIHHCQSCKAHFFVSPSLANPLDSRNN